MHGYKCVKTYSNGLCILSASSQQWINVIFMERLVSKFLFLNEMNSDIPALASQPKPFRLCTLHSCKCHIVLIDSALKSA